MKEQIVHVELNCIYCNDDTPHKIIYINDEIKSVECEICHVKLEKNIDFMREFLKELYDRVSKKPATITKEYKQDLNHFLKSMPKRIISKPYRIMKELSDSKDIIKKYRK